MYTTRSSKELIEEVFEEYNSNNDEDVMSHRKSSINNIHKSAAIEFQRTQLNEDVIIMVGEISFEEA